MTQFDICYCFECARRGKTHQYLSDFDDFALIWIRISKRIQQNHQSTLEIESILWGTASSSKQISLKCRITLLNRHKDDIDFSNLGRLVIFD